MPNADLLPMIFTDTSWCIANDAWRLDINPARWRCQPEDRLRLVAFGAEIIEWHHTSDSGVLHGGGLQAALHASLPVDPQSLLTFTVKAAQPPRLLALQLVRLHQHGVTGQFLPSCGQRSSARLSAEPPLVTSDDLLAQARTADSALVEAAARLLLADDRTANAQLVLGVLAQVARNQTPDGLIDLMTHLGSGKGHE